MMESGKNNSDGAKFIRQVVWVFGYFDLILKQLKNDSKESFSHSLFIFKKISKNMQLENLLITDEPDAPTIELFSKDLKFCKERLSEIIMLLQFEDILDQKFDHISKINEIVINALQHNSDLKEESKLLLLMKTVQLNSKQLEYIKQEHAKITRDLKDKLKEIYGISEIILSFIKDQKKAGLLNATSDKIRASMGLIKSYVEKDILKFSVKVDALIKIFEVLEVNIIPSGNTEISGFDLQIFLDTYTIESERTVFYKVFKGMVEENLLKSKTTNSDIGEIEFFN